jgi:hypothetical protein
MGSFRQIVIGAFVLAAAGLGAAEYFGLRDDYNALLDDGGAAFSSQEKTALLSAMLMRAAADGDHTKTLALISKMKSLSIASNPSLQFLEGRAFLKSDQRDRGVKILEAYIDTVGREGAFYRQSLTLLAQAEIAEQQAAVAAQLDQHIARLAGAIKAKQYSNALASIGNIKAIDVSAPRSLPYYEGMVLALTGKKANARTVLEPFVANGNPQNAYVKKASGLIGDLGGVTLAVLQTRAAEAARKQAATRITFKAASYDSGDRFAGRYKGNGREGGGVYTWKSGWRYEGDWKNSVRHGYGVDTSPGGFAYYSRYANGKRTGLVFIEKGAYKKAYTMTGGKSTGPAYIHHRPGVTFYGSLKDGKEDGYGVIYGKALYRGMWRKGKQIGDGMRYAYSPARWKEVDPKHPQRWRERYVACKRNNRGCNGFGKFGWRSAYSFNSERAYYQNGKRTRSSTTLFEFNDRENGLAQQQYQRSLAAEKAAINAEKVARKLEIQAPEVKKLALKAATLARQAAAKAN